MNSNIAFQRIKKRTIGKKNRIPGVFVTLSEVLSWFKDNYIVLGIVLYVLGVITTYFGYKEYGVPLVDLSQTKYIISGFFCLIFIFPGIVTSLASYIFFNYTKENQKEFYTNMLVLLGTSILIYIILFNLFSLIVFNWANFIINLVVYIIITCIFYTILQIIYLLRNMLGKAKMIQEFLALLFVTVLILYIFALCRMYIFNVAIELPPEFGGTSFDTVYYHSYNNKNGNIEQELVEYKLLEVNDLYTLYDVETEELIIVSISDGFIISKID